MALFALVLLVTAGAVLALSRGRAARLTDLPVRSLWLAPLALALQVPVLRGMGGAAWRGGLLLLSYGLLFLFLWRNRHLLAARILALGFLLNFLVIIVNGGFMPIAPETLALIRPGSTVADWQPGTLDVGSKDIVLSATEIRLRFLADIFVIPSPFPLPTAFSLGDAVILVGFAAFFWDALTASSQEPRS